jgi:hypothetical protein
MHLTPQHDGRLVADIVAEWASIHGEPFEDQKLCTPWPTITTTGSLRTRPDSSP